MTKKIKCQRCNYEWNYTGKRLYTSCPKCMTSVKVRSFNPKIDIKQNKKIGD